MGIRLDWEIEAENERVESAGEDPESLRRRWRARLRLFGLLLVVLTFAGMVIGGLVLRLRQVDWEIEQALRDTVETEVATLRIGDHRTFQEMQRSATDEWLARQDELFGEYQTLLLEKGENVQLTGHVIAASVDGQRGRVQVEEIIDGARYVQTWFYWRYEDGWRHVPPDYTFWGTPQTLQNDRVTLYYRELDQPAAQLAFDQLTAWLTTGCEALSCAAVPHLTVDIVPNPLAQVQWVDNWMLQIPSPYLERAPVDAPLTPGTRFQLAVLMARRLVDEQVATGLTGEAAFLRDAVVSWLVERFAQVQMESYLVYSLAARYDAPAVGRLLSALTPDATAAVLSQVTGMPLEQAGLDWRDYIEWRLSQELSGQELDVLSTTVEYSADGVPQIRAQVQSGTLQTEIVYQLVDGLWRRTA